MRSLILLLALCALGGCMKTSDLAAGAEYHLRDVGVLDHSDTRRTASWRLQADSFVYIAQSHYEAPGEGALPRPNVVADEAFKAFVEYFPLVRRSPQPLGLDEAMNEARVAGAHYLLYTRFAGSADRIGTLEEWEDEEAVDRLGIDTGVIQLMLIETSTRYLVDTARIRNRGGILTFYDNQPADQLRAPFAQYARTLLGVSER
jgi:hypothetical protein